MNWSVRQRNRNKDLHGFGREILLHLLRDFVASAGKVGTRPVLMLIPRVNKWKHGRIDPAYREFVTRFLSSLEWFSTKRVPCYLKALL
ncbi:MAG: hypothetical protein U9Q75_01510 [Pseudomonadota bacterium]|nr:hypothetical protein [Pseudomonadota bacterium]